MYQVDEYKKSLKHVVDKEGLSVYEFKPCPFQLLAIPFEKLRFVRRVRLLLEYLRGRYKVYYLAIEGRVVGYCVITPGGRRLKCSNKNDAVIGPYYICRENRGQGLSKKMIAMVLGICKEQFESVYAWVDKTNTPSIRCLEACGFMPVGRLDVVGLFRRLLINPNGTDIIYKK